MKKKIRKITGSILSFALAAAMVMGLSGMTALAAEGDEAATTTQTIIVHEKVNGTADISFDYHIYQITEAEKPIETMDDIITFVAGSNLDYVIYDSSSGQALGTETTDSDGGFSLSAEEYAEFTVAAETDWFVFQDTPDEYPLADEDGVTAEGSHASVVDNTNGVVQYESEEEPTPTTGVDKEALEKAIEEAKTLDSSDYTPESWEALETALANAEKVFADSDATQDEVDQALKDLQDAEDGLEKAETVNKSELEEEYETDALLKEKKDDYTPESWEPFEEALDKAESIINDKDATQEEVNEALADLKEAKEGLKEVEKVDKSELQKEYDEDSTLKKDDYTSESWAPFADALEEAKDVLENDDATQEEVNEALKTLEEAKDALEKVPEPEPALTVSVEISSGLEDNTKTYDGDAFTLTATAEVEPETAEVSYQWYRENADGEYEPIEGATLDMLSVDGKVSDSGTYKCVVTAANDDETATGEAVITITIEKAAQDISYEETLVKKTLEDEPFINELTVTKLSDDEGAGIIYASSNDEVVSIDPATGEVTILAEGTATISAMAVGTANYEEQTAVYVIEIAPSVDKSVLQEEYDEDSTLDESDYTSASWEPFAAALEQAKTVLDNPDATQEEVDEALENLISARDKLEKPAPVQPTVSDVTITSNIEGNSKDYDGAGFNLTVSAQVNPEGAEVSYQWYTVAEDGTETPIDGATNNVYTTGSEVSASGTYKCVVTATNDGLTATADDQITITIEKAEQDISYKTTVVTKNDDDPDFTNELREGTVYGEITYTSSDEKVATVDEDGVVAIHSAGMTTITATAAGSDNYTEATASYVLTVNVAGFTWEIDVNGAKATWDDDMGEYTDDETYTGDSIELKVVINETPDEAGEVDTIAYQWYRFNPDELGLIEIDGATEDTYTLADEEVYAGDFIYVCLATVTYKNTNVHMLYCPIEITIEKAAQDISYAETEVTKDVGEGAFTNELTKTKISTDQDAAITYTSSEESVATVDEDGEVTIVGIGTATITATAVATANYKEATASYTLTVNGHDWEVEWTWTGLPKYVDCGVDGYEHLSIIQPWNVVQSLDIATFAGDLDDVTATAAATCKNCGATETVKGELTAAYSGSEPTEYNGALAIITATATFSDNQTATDEKKVIAAATGSLEVNVVTSSGSAPTDGVAFSDINTLINQTLPFTIDYTTGSLQHTTMPFVHITDILKTYLDMEVDEDNFCCFMPYAPDGQGQPLTINGYIYQRDQTGTYYYRTAEQGAYGESFWSNLRRIDVVYTHDWDEENAKWVWADDNSSATVTVACKRTTGRGFSVCKHPCTADTTTIEYTVTTDPTATEPGVGTYTATATLDDGQTITGTKTVEIPVATPVDKSALQAEYDADSKLIESDYTEESWPTFATALTSAKSVLDDSAATQDNVDAALETLQTARGDLVAAPVDSYVADTSWYDPDESEYTLTTVNQLVGLSAIVNGTADGVDQDSFKDKTVTLANSMKMNEDDTVSWSSTGAAGSAGVTTTVSATGANAFTPIGNGRYSADSYSTEGTISGYEFLGTFDGNFKEIQNLYITGDSGYLGLFGLVGATDSSGACYGTVENLTIASGVIYDTEATDGSDFVGAVCGKLSAGGTIQNVINKADVEAPGVYNVGGIVGFAGTAVSLSTDNNGGTTTDNPYLSNPSRDNTKVLQCGNEGTVHGYNKVGGITGETAATIKFCYNKGWIFNRRSGSKDGIGGIVGINGNNNTALQESITAYCYNTGLISNNGYPDGHDKNSMSTLRYYGGIAGWGLGGKGGNEIYNCYNIGAIPEGYVNGHSFASIVAGLEYASEVVVRNNYSLISDSINNDSKGVMDQEKGIQCEESQFTSTEYADNDVLTGLGPYFVADTTNLNNSYPVLWWEADRTAEPDDTATGLTIASEPAKTTYSAGDKFDPTGLTVMATYNSGAKALIYPKDVYYEGDTSAYGIPATWITMSDGFTCEPDTLTAGTDEVTISYAGASTTVKVTVN